MNSILEERSKLTLLEAVPDGLKRTSNKTPSFNQYLREQLITEEVNTHMTHIEDLVFDGGVRGTRKAIEFFRDLRDSLSGHSKAPSNITLKYDGCIHEDTLVCTNKGDIPIRELLSMLSEGEKDISVLGRNLNNGSDDYTTIMGYGAKSGDKDWVEIELENGKSIRTTEDHEVHTTNRGWVKAGELTESDDITEI